MVFFDCYYEASGDYRLDGFAYYAKQCNRSLSLRFLKLVPSFA